MSAVTAFGVRQPSGPVARRLAMGLLVLALVMSAATCRLDKLINPATGDRLLVNPDSVRASANVGSLQAVDTTLHVSSADGVALAWTATKTARWVTLTPSADSLIVRLHPDTLSQTPHLDTIVFTSGGVATVKVPIVLDMLPAAAELVVSPTNRDTSAFVGSAQPDTFSLRIKNTGALPLNWTAALNATWVTLSDSGGTVPPQDTTSTIILVTLSPDSLGTGAHSERIVFAAPGAIGAPDTVPITYTIAPCVETGITLDTIKNSSIALSDCGAPKKGGSQAKLYAVQLTAGDTLSLRLSSTAFDAFLVLTNNAGDSVAANDECGVEVGTACINRYIVPSNGRYVIEATTAAAGATGAFTLLAVRERTPSAPAAGQFRANGSTAIGVGAVTPESTVVFEATLIDPNPFDSVRLEVEVEGLASGIVTDSSAFVPRGTSASLPVTRLRDNEEYHWRARTCDKTGRCSAWFNFGGNVDPAADFRVNSIPQPPGAPSTPDQFNGTGQMQIPPGGGTGGGLGSAQTITFRAVVTDPDPGDMISLEVEVQDIANAFGGGGTLGVAVLSDSTASVSVVRNAPPLIGQNNYYWRVRACDQVSQCSAWVSFGGTSGDSPPRVTDFHVP